MLKKLMLPVIALFAFTHIATLPCAWGEEETSTPSSSPGSEDTDHHIYRKIEPSKALGVRVAISKFPIKTAIGSTYQLYGDYILPFYALGAFSLGVHGGLFPLNTLDNSVIPSNTNNWIAGLHATYQLKFIENQLIVPIFSVDWEWMSIQKSDESILYTNNFGGSVGAMILLSPFDSRTAQESYESVNMVRAYLTAQWQPMVLTTPSTEVNGAMWFWGVRLEFE